MGGCCGYDSYYRTSIRLIVADEARRLETVRLLNYPRCFGDPFAIPAAKNRRCLKRILSFSVSRIVDRSMKGREEKQPERRYVTRLYVAGNG